MGKETWARHLGEDKKPGPADYTTSGKTGSTTPSYTIKQKYPEREDLIAQPYVNLPTTIGESPRYTIRPQTDLPPSYIFPHHLETIIYAERMERYKHEVYL